MSKTRKPLPTQSRLHELFNYDGFRLIHKKSHSIVKAGEEAGFTSFYGYVVVRVDGIKFYAHRLIWVYVNGSVEGKDIDHINGMRGDNRIANLRLVTRSENNQNLRQARSNNKLGVLGVSPKFGKFVAQIRRGGKYISLGLFETAELAHQAYLEAKRESHPGCTI